jgi:cyclic pyranopterin phosphate synthase
MIEKCTGILQVHFIFKAMRDISSKNNTLRIASARATVRLSPVAFDAIQHNSGPKTDILPTARVAAFMAVKNTAAALPHCHPVPVEACDVVFEVQPDRIDITVTVKTTYKTGCEMEAMHGASIAALTVYDMLKPVDKLLEIEHVQLMSKSGGKSGDVFRSI